MPTEYTPTTENVRAWWSLRAEPNDLDERHAEFDRWLAQVKAEAAAQAWAKEHAAQCDSVECAHENPYRKGQTDAD